MSGESSSKITYIMKTLAVPTFSVFCRLDAKIQKVCYEIIPEKTLN